MEDICYLFLVAGIIIGVGFKYFFDICCSDKSAPVECEPEPRKSARKTQCTNCKYDQIHFFPITNDQICNNIRVGGECRRRNGSCRYAHEGAHVELFQNLNTATKQLDICVYLINYDALLDFLIRLKSRPQLKIRIITDKRDEESDNTGHKNHRQKLKKAGFDVRINHDDEGLMHHKFAIIDRQIVIHGSFNWTHSAIRYNREAMHITANPSIVKSFQEQFNLLWSTFQVQPSV